MKKDNLVYVAQINGSTQDRAYTSLKAFCIFYDIPYGPASKGKTAFAIKSGDEWFTILIVEVELIKIPGRENNHKGKRK